MPQFTRQDITCVLTHYWQWKLTPEGLRKRSPPNKATSLFESNPIPGGHYGTLANGPPGSVDFLAKDTQPIGDEARLHNLDDEMGRTSEERRGILEMHFRVQRNPGKLVMNDLAKRLRIPIEVVEVSHDP